MTKPVVVVGAGITGLATAWFLRTQEPGREVVVVDADERAGGKIRTEAFDGGTVELGPDAFIARVPEGVELCKAVGLDDLVAPSAGKAFLWTRGRVRPLPEGLVLGLPTELVAVARSGILSPRGVARAGLDVVLPRHHANGDRSVGSLVRARFGDEVHERLVDPLLGGIHAGDTDALSVDATAPQLASAARAHRSLLLGLRASAPASPSGSPVFLTPRAGLGTLVDRLTDGLDLRLGTAVSSLERTNDDEWRVSLASGDTLDASAVVLTTPSFVTADLVRSLSPDVADRLRAIEYASVALVVMAYARDAVPAPLGGSGFLVPRGDGRLMTACSWASAKWPHWQQNDHVWLRVSAGKSGDDRAMQLDDVQLVQQLHNELTEALGFTDGPLLTRVARWPRSFPQYTVGHLDRVAAIDSGLARSAPGVFVAGAAYRGVGIPACIAQAKAAAAKARQKG
ncbi:MAG TPA: protoporphyrinogen oxidase [Acidimicrobiales bacterium]|nr:protoporphyrinogen oxidase [Acidimicrobiales bacterium]